MKDLDLYVQRIIKRFDKIRGNEVEAPVSLHPWAKGYTFLKEVNIQELNNTLKEYNLVVVPVNIAYPPYLEPNKQLRFIVNKLDSKWYADYLQNTHNYFN